MAANDPSIDLKDYLVNQGVGSFAASTGWSINIGEQPDSPNTTITLFTRGGRAANPKWTLDDLDVQVRVRGDRNDYQNTYDKTQEIKDVLLAATPGIINGTDYKGILSRGDINLITRDDSDRFIFTYNIQVYREPASTGTNRLSF